MRMYDARYKEKKEHGTSQNFEMKFENLRISQCTLFFVLLFFLSRPFSLICCLILFVFWLGKRETRAALRICFVVCI